MTTSQNKDNDAFAKAVEAAPEMVEANKGPTPNHFIRRCFDCFDYAEIQTFCKIYFTELAQNINWGGKSTRDAVVGEIIFYCAKEDKFEDLWNHIRLIQPTIYTSYYDQWKNASTNEKVRNQNSASLLQKDYQAEDTNISQSGCDVHHSLESDDLSKINEWFLALSNREKSLALTVALFQGIQRHYLESIGQEIEQLLFVSDQPNSPNKKRHNSIGDGDLINRWKRINIALINVQRSTISGATVIQTLSFPNANHRQKVLRVLNYTDMYQKLSLLLDFLYRLGCSEEGEKRFFAASAISQLVFMLGFSGNLKDVIEKWGKGEKAQTQQVAATALVLILQHESDGFSDTNPILQKNSEQQSKQSVQRPIQCKVLQLLIDWLKSENSELVSTALHTYFEIAQDFPMEAIDAAKEIAGKPIEVRISESKTHTQVEIGNVHFVCGELVRQIYGLSPRLVVNALYEWLNTGKEVQLGLFARIWFLAIVQLEDIATDDTLRKKAVEFVFELWENPKLNKLHPELNHLTTLKMKEWATIATTVNNNDCRLFFRDLHRKYSGRLDNKVEILITKLQKEQKNGKSYARK